MSDPVPAPTCSHCGGPSIGLPLCQKCRNEYGTVQGRLRTIGVLGNKHIPVQYLRGSAAQRRAVLAGLLDTDGTVSAGGSVDRKSVGVGIECVSTGNYGRSTDTI